MGLAVVDGKFGRAQQRWIYKEVLHHGGIEECTKHQPGDGAVNDSNSMIHIPSRPFLTINTAIILSNVRLEHASAFLGPYVETPGWDVFDSDEAIRLKWYDWI